MNIDIDLMTMQELEALNDRIIERLRLLDSMQAYHAMRAFNIGTRVSFDSKRGRQVGRLTKFNQKTVTVLTEDGCRWRISPHLLSEVKEVEAVADLPTTGESSRCK